MTELHHFSSASIMVPLPDTQQKTSYSCGPMLLMSVARHFGSAIHLETESDFIRLLTCNGMRKSVGAHPAQMVGAAQCIGLSSKEYQGMTDVALRSELRRERPVLMMIQAWPPDVKPRTAKVWKRTWKEGHWVGAIGYDKKGVLFEDPSLEAIRGFLTWEELDARWHDLGPNHRKLTRYGLVIWRDDSSRDGYQGCAQGIG